MAISRLSDSSIQSGFPKYTSLWDGRSAVGSMDAIGAITLSAAQSTITFSNIPSTYTHLQIRGIARTNRAGSNQDALRYRFNSDNASNYSHHYLLGNGSAASSGANTSISGPLIDGFTESDNLSGTFGSFVLDILDYANTNKYKTCRALSGREDNTAGAVWLESGLWMSTSAISSIVLTPNAGTSINQYSSFALYGIK